jgi:anaerobic selenocysteine-containing dehydrogenase
MLFGSTPLASMVAGAGASQIAFTDPVKTMNAPNARGMKIIVADPRKSETAKFADIHLQPRPGCDAEIAAAMLHTILERDWHDAVFCDAYVDGVDELKRLVWVASASGPASACLTRSSIAARKPASVLPEPVGAEMTV